MFIHNHDEIVEFTHEGIERCIVDSVDKDEWHHEIFNTNYYIIGTYRAEQWLAGYAFKAIAKIKKYETDNFGEVMTDLSNPEAVVNMYVYIAGEYLLDKLVENILEESV